MVGFCWPNIWSFLATPCWSEICRIAFTTVGLMLSGSIVVVQVCLTTWTLQVFWFVESAKSHSFYVIYIYPLKLDYYSCFQTKSEFFDKPTSLYWLLDMLLPTDSSLPVVAAASWKTAGWPSSGVAEQDRNHNNNKFKDWKVVGFEMLWVRLQVPKSNSSDSRALVPKCTFLIAFLVRS